jgi:K+/H+ antiporter YhaU regulatory subunit KhtT
VAPVVGRDGRFVGMLARGAIHAAMRARLATERERAAEASADVAALEQEGRLALLLSGIESGGGAAPAVERMQVPHEAAGRSLREADFRRTFGCHVIAVQTAKGETIAPPDPERPLAGDDLLVVVHDRKPLAGGEG